MKGISSRFINYAFSSELVKERLQKLKSGTTSVVGIYYKGLRNLKIPVTEYEEQQAIVRQLDALRTETQKLEAVYQKKMDDLEELKKSILQKAFRGELVEPAGELTQTKHYDLHDESLSLAAEPKSKMQKQNG